MKYTKFFLAMKKISQFIFLSVFMICIITQLKGQDVENKAPLKEGLFDINEIDLHVHAGRERPLPLEQWIDMFVLGGRRVLLLLDHLELYRMTGDEQKKWLKKNKVENWYPDSSSARTDFRNDLIKAGKRNDILIFHGWEIWEGEIDEGLEKEPMKDAEVIGWHISKAAWEGKAPGGKELISRARQIVEIQKEFPVPMIIFHPFAGRIKAVKDAAAKAGLDPSSITRDEFRYFTPDEQWS